MRKVLANNKKAYFDYFINDTLECGIELKGTEVKSVRQGKVSIKEAWIDIEAGELLVKGMHISPYEQGNRFNTDPLRVRRLLAHKREIRNLVATRQQDGMTVVPLSVYLSGGRIKVEIGLCKGKKLHDKRQVLKEKAVKRDMERG